MLCWLKLTEWDCLCWFWFVCVGFGLVLIWLACLSIGLWVGLSSLFVFVSVTFSLSSFLFVLCRHPWLQPQPLLPGGVTARGTAGGAEGTSGDWEEAAGPSPRLDPLKLESSRSLLSTELLQVESTSDVANTTIGCSVPFPVLLKVRCQKVADWHVGDERRAHQHG